VSDGAQHPTATLSLAPVRAPRATAFDAVALSVCVAAAPVLYALFSGVRFEDSYFFFQFARNIATGHGFAFNPDRPIFAATSPLYTLLITALTWLDLVPIERAALMLNSALLSVQALCLYGLLRPLSRGAALLVCALCAADAFAIYPYLSMDTALFSALCVASCWAIAARRATAAGVCLGLALWTRYDAGLLVVAYAATTWASERRVPWRTLFVAGAVFAPWFVFAAFYFGSPLPSTLHAKIGAVAYPEFLFDACVWLIDLPGLRLLPPLLAGAAALALLAAAVVEMRGRLRPLVPLAVFGVCHVWAYAIIGPPLGEKWHLHVARVAFGTLLVMGGAALFERAAASRALRLGPLSAALAVALLAAAVAGTRAHSRDLPNAFWISERDAIYREVAAFVRAHVRAGQRFMPSEVATLGYLTRLPMIDPFGLLNESNGYLRTRARADHFALVQRYKPDLLLLDWPKHARWIEQRSPYRTVKVFAWINPFSVLLVRDASVLADPGEMPALRAAAERDLDRAPSVGWRRRAPAQLR
jgi:hypothetical protein